MTPEDEARAATSELEAVVKRELQATLELFDSHIAQMRLAAARIQAHFDDLLENVERRAE